MSLILEALRKSEAERQLGRAPGLLTPMPIPPRERRLGLTLALGLPLLVLVAVGGWWLGRGGDAGVPGGPLPTAANPPAALEPPALRPLRDTPTTADVADTATPPAAATPPATDASRRERPAAPRGAASQAIAAPSDHAQAAVPAPDPTPTVVPAPTPTMPAAVPPATIATDVEPAVAAPSAPPPAAAPAAERTGPTLPGLESVDAARRAALPPLRISLHMYNDDPAQRFVLIDGRRYSEGQAIDAAMQVSEIRRDGVVLAIDGRDVLLRRP